MQFGLFMMPLHPPHRDFAESYRRDLDQIVLADRLGFREAVARAEEKILGCGKVALGGIAFSPDDARAMIARGHRFVVLGSYAGLVSGAARRTIEAIRA